MDVDGKYTCLQITSSIISTKDGSQPVFLTGDEMINMNDMKRKEGVGKSRALVE